MNTPKSDPVARFTQDLKIILRLSCQGQIFRKRQSARLLYRKRLRQCQATSNAVYTNELHEALLRKDGPTFWKYLALQI